MSKLIEEFYNQSEFKDSLTLEQMKEICKSPFLFLKSAMASGELKDIRFQYFGVFEVSEYKVKHNKAKLEGLYKEGLISTKRYKERLQILNNYETKD